MREECGRKGGGGGRSGGPVNRGSEASGDSEVEVARKRQQADHAKDVKG